MRLVSLALVCFATGCGFFASLDRPPGPGALSPGGIEDAGVPVLAQRWRHEVHPGGDRFRPQEFAEAAVAESRFAGRILFVGSYGGDTLALRARDGHTVWTADTGAVGARPLVVDNTVYLGTAEGVMLALDVAAGDEKWRHETSGVIEHAPVIVGDLLVFSNEEDRVIALDKQSGKWRWEYRRDRPEDFTVRGHSGVATDGAHVYAGFADGHLVAIDAATGDPVWVRSLAGTNSAFVDVDGMPTLADGVLYASSVAGGLYALEPADGTELWRLPVEGAGSVTPDGDRLYFAAADSGLYATDRDGHILWRQGLAGAGDPAPPVISGDYLLQSLAGKGLFVIRKHTGELLQVFDPGGGVSAQPTVLGDSLFVLSNGGTLYAFDLQ